MNSLARPNPFTRQHLFSPAPPLQPSVQNKTHKPHSHYEPLPMYGKPSEPPRTQHENPFMSRCKLVEEGSSRIRYQSENKMAHDDGLSYGSQNRNKYSTTYIPLSKLENKLKLRDLDPEGWRREQEEQERSKVSIYGVDALRYTNYQSIPNPVHSFNSHPNLADKTSQTSQKIPLQRVNSMGELELNKKITFSSEDRNQDNDRNHKQKERRLRKKSTMENFHDELHEKGGMSSHHSQKWASKISSHADSRVDPHSEYFPTYTVKPPNASSHHNVRQLMKKNHDSKNESSFSRDLIETPHLKHNFNSRLELDGHDDHINMQYESFNYGDVEHSRKKGPLHGLQFLSQDDYILEESRREQENGAYPYAIEYGGKSFFQLRIM